MKPERKRRSMTLSEAAREARELAARLTADVEKAGNREDHIRLSARANEADGLATQLEELVSSEAASPIV